MNLHRFRTFLGLEHNIIIMLAGTLILGMGEELWMRFIPKYLEVLGAGVWVIAAYGTLKDLLDALYQYPGGWLYDHLGRKYSLILFTAIAIAGYIIYLASPTWEWMIFGTLWVSAWATLSSPSIFAIIGDSLPSERRAIGFGVQSTLKRIPIVLAPIAGGWMILEFGLALGIQIGLAITIGLAICSMFVVSYFYRETKNTDHQPMHIGAVWKKLDVRLKRLLVADCLARWAEGIPKVFIILYVINIIGLDSFQFGTLTSIQMIASILVYIPLAKLSDSMNRKPFVTMTFFFFALFPLSLALSGNFSLAVIAFIIGGLREIGEPARKALIVDLATASARGRTVGMYYLVRGMVVFPASIVGGWLWSINAQLPLYAASVIGIIGCFVYIFFVPSEH